MNHFSFILLCGLIPVALNGQSQSMQQSLLQQLQEHVALREVNALPPQRPHKCAFSLIARIRTLNRPLTDEESRLLRLLETRPICDTSILSSQGHFRIHFDTTGFNAGSLLDANFQKIPNTVRAYADSVAEIFEYVWEKEINELGYPAPPADDGIGGDDAYDIYINEYNGNAYGETYPDSTMSDTNPALLSSSFIKIDNDYFGYYSKGLNGVRVTAAHEFFHAIQIGNYRLWTVDVSPFFYEISSTWMEDEVFPAVKDYIQYVRFAFSMTDIPLNESNGWVEYGRAIFAKFLEKKFGRSLIHEIWEAIRSVPSLQAIVNTLNRHDTSLESVYPEYALCYYYTGPRANATLYFPEGDLYPEVTIHHRYQFFSSSLQISDSLQNLAFQYDKIVDGDTATLLTTNVNIVSALNNSQTSYPFGYLIQNYGGDETFITLSNGWKVKFQPSDDSQNWNSIAFLKASIYSRDDPPYPNPFIADRTRQIVFPVWTQGDDAELAVYSSDLREIYHGRKGVDHKFGKTMIQWDGVMNNGLLAPSGIYYYVMTVKGDTHRGKIAILQK